MEGAWVDEGLLYSGESDLDSLNRDLGWPQLSRS